MTRHRTLERSAVVAARGAARRRRDAVCRARGDSHARHDRRQPRARRSGRRAAGRDARARRARSRCEAAGARGRSAPTDFFTGLFSTALEPGELLTEIDDSAAGRRERGYAFEEISRRHGDFALAGAAASVTLDEQGRCTTARVALLSVGDRPVLAEHAGGAGREQPTSDRRFAAPPRPPPRTTSIRPATFTRPAVTAASWRRADARVLERAFHSAGDRHENLRLVAAAERAGVASGRSIRRSR